MTKEETFSFQALYTSIVAYNGGRIFDEVMMPQTVPARQLVQALSSSAVRTSVKPLPEELWRWYALSRVNDRLLLGLQAGGRHSAAVSAAQYAEFFAALGFTLFGSRSFSPFYHEIVEVIEDPTLTGRPRVEQVLWPGLLFGEMLFSRAGVCVRCPAGLYQKAIAENSCLYFTFQRLRRRTQDLSRGWGSNSQWATAFRRDYGSGGILYYNVDGKHPLGPGYEASFTPGMQGPGDELTLEERVELLTHRGFVRCPKDDQDCWPYDDTFQEPAPESAPPEEKD